MALDLRKGQAQFKNAQVAKLYTAIGLGVSSTYCKSGLKVGHTC